MKSNTPVMLDGYEAPTIGDIITRMRVLAEIDPMRQPGVQVGGASDRFGLLGHTVGSQEGLGFIVGEALVALKVNPEWILEWEVVHSESALGLEALFKDIGVPNIEFEPDEMKWIIGVEGRQLGWQGWSLAVMNADGNWPPFLHDPSVSPPYWESSDALKAIAWQEQVGMRPTPGRKSEDV